MGRRPVIPAAGEPGAHRIMNDGSLRCAAGPAQVGTRPLWRSSGGSAWIGGIGQSPPSAAPIRRFHFVKWAPSNDAAVRWPARIYASWTWDFLACK